MTGYVVNPRYGEVLIEFRDTLIDFQINEAFSTTVFHCLKMIKIYPRGKICFFELIAERFKKGIELLDFQIQSYSFQDPK